MATSLPPLPTDSNMTGANPSTPPQGQGGPPSQSPSAFGGGLSSMMQAIQQIEQGYMMLAKQLPSLAPIAADAISKLRMAVPNAVGAGAGQQGPPQQAGQNMSPSPGGGPSGPPPPSGGPPNG